MDFITSVIAAAISILLYFLIYGKLSQISRKLDAQNKYYSKLIEDRQLEEQNRKHQETFKDKIAKVSTWSDNDPTPTI